MNTFVLDLIKEKSIYQLWNCEGGCPCGEFYIAGINIEFDCWRTAHRPDGKAGSLITIKADDDLEPPREYLEQIAKECLKQIRELWSNTDWTYQIIKNKI